MEVRADQRSIEARREPEAEQIATEGVAALRELQIRLARSLARIDASAHFVFSGCASVVEYAVKLGYSSQEARMLVSLGKTLDAAPDVERRLRKGMIPIEAASAVGRIFANPALLRPGDDWLHAAATEPLRALRRKIRERIEMHAQGEVGLEEVTVHVTPHTKDQFARAREVASQKAGKPLTDGQTLHRVVDYYLEKNDPLRQKGGTRRTGPTRDDPANRYVPREVVRAVWKRADGRCEVPACEHALKLELAHKAPHKHGSAREADDLGLLCPRHHLLYDAGTIGWPVATPAAPASNKNPASGSGPTSENGAPWPDGVRERAPPLAAVG